MIVADLDEVSYDLEVDGEPVRRQLDRLIVERGTWATVAVLYAERAPGSAEWKAPRVALLRFQKVRGVYKKHAALTLGQAGARSLIERLTAWAPQLGADDGDAA